MAQDASPNDLTDIDTADPSEAPEADPNLNLEKFTGDSKENEETTPPATVRLPKPDAPDASEGEDELEYPDVNLTFDALPEGSARFVLDRRGVHQPSI